MDINYYTSLEVSFWLCCTSEQNVGFLILKKYNQSIMDDKNLEKHFKVIQNSLSSMDQKFTGRFDKADKRFNEMDKQFELFDKRFNVIDKRFDKSDKHFKEIDKRFDKSDKHFEEIDVYFNKIGKNFNEIAEELQRHQTVLTAIFEIVSDYDTDRIKMKSDIWDLQKAVAEPQSTVNPNKKQTV